MEDTSLPLPRPRDLTPDPRLLERFIAGECTLIERIAMERWIAVNPVQGAAILALQMDGELESAVTDPLIDIDRAQQTIAKQAGIPEIGGNDANILIDDNSGNIVGGTSKLVGSHVGLDQQPLPRNPRYTRLWSTVAAFGVVALVTFGGWLYHIRHDQSGSFVHTYSTSSGKPVSLTLTDGTRVILAPGTSLSVTNNFGKSTRHVSLVGEAYFDVRSTTDAPFVVQTGDIFTRVLGTAFTVRRYHNAREAVVAVEKGKVSVGSTPHSTTGIRNPTVVLSAGMIGAVTDSTAIGTRIDDISAYTQWINGKLVFRDTPIPQVLEILGHWYGLEFRLADSTLATHDLSDTFEYSTSAEMLNALKMLLNVTMTFQGNVVTLHSKSTAKKATPRRDKILKHLQQSHREMGL
jgi:transmembrane sensor